MGRPSLSAERRAQVIRAFGRCVARAGFAGTSLEKVAEEAGLARGHVRHYLGNRHDQMMALAEWVSTGDRAEFARVAEAPDDRSRVDAVVHYLFDPSFYEPGEDMAVFLALFEEALRDDALRKLFLDSYNEILDTMVSALVGASHADLPGREPLSADDADGIAYLLLCAAVGNAHLAQTGISPARAGRLGAFCRRALALLTRG
jgi:AcrR family transcriptional regulator